MRHRLPPGAGPVAAFTLATAGVIYLILANRVAGIVAAVLLILGTAAAWLRNR